MLVRHFMSRDVITLRPEQSCNDARRVFKQYKIRRAPVLDNDRLVGIVSERNILHALPGTVGQLSTEAGKRSMDIHVKNIMKTNVVAISPNEHLETAAHLMMKNKIGGLPVLNNGILQGIITESDIFKAMWDIFSFKKGCGILIFNKENKDINDYVALAVKNNCHVRTFIRYTDPNGGHFYYLCVDSDDVDTLLQEIWSCHAEVLLVDRKC